MTDHAAPTAGQPQAAPAGQPAAPTPEQLAAAAAMVGRGSVESQKQNTQSAFEREKQAAFRAIAAQKSRYLENLKTLQSLQGTENLATLSNAQAAVPTAASRPATQTNGLTELLMERIIEEVKTLISVEVERQLAARFPDGTEGSLNAAAGTNNTVGQKKS